MRRQQIQLKKPKSSKKKRIILIAVLAIALVGAGGFVAWHKHKNDVASSTNEGTSKNSAKIRPQNSIDYSPATSDDNKATEQEKSKPTENGTIDNNESPAPTAGDFSVTITGANADNTNKLARVSSLVNGITDGACTVTFTKSGQTTVAATNQVTLQTNSYACPNFAIPYDQFSASGEWTVSLTVVNNNKQVTAAWPAGPITITK